MRTTSSFLVSLAIVVLLPNVHAGMHSTAGTTGATQVRRVSQYDALPMVFEPNEGQTDGTVRFLARGLGYGVFLTQTSAILSLRGDPVATGTRADSTIRIRLLGANPRSQVSGIDLLPGISNYFIGNDPARWHTSVPNYGKIRYAEVYPGIALIYYGRQRQLEYDFVVSPGADPGRVVLHFGGIKKLTLDPEGNLILTTASGDIVQRKPTAYQETDGVLETVDVRYRLRGKHKVEFAVSRHDPTRPLVIDPVLVYSSYLGGGFAQGKGIAADDDGNVYVTGETIGSPFPTTSGAYQVDFGGGGDAFVAKLNSTLSALIYSTYLGGRGGDFGHAIAVDSSGNAYVTGYTQGGFPTTPGVYQSAFGGGGADAFVTKLNATGTALIYSTYLGGAGGDSANGLGVDGSGNAYVTGGTTGGFPTTPGAFQVRYGGGGGSAFVAKLNPNGSSVLYSTYLGGASQSFGSGVAVDSAGNVYVVGVTGPGFPTTPGVYQPTFGGADVNAFAAKMGAEGNVLVYSTYLGGRLWSSAVGVAVDGSGNAYVTGATGGDFPTTSDAYQATYGGGFDDAFVTKLNATGNALDYSTYLGGVNSDTGYSIAIDASGNAFVTGRTYGGFPVSPDAFQTTFGGTFDAFLAELHASGRVLVYSTYLGGANDDQGYAIAMDRYGRAYVTGVTRGGFPTTAGAYQTAASGALSDAFVVSLTTIPAPPAAIPSGIPTLSGWALIGLGGVLGLGALVLLRSRNLSPHE